MLLVTDRVLGLSEGERWAWSWLLAGGLYLAVYLWIGYDVLLRAGRGILGGSPLDENFLMCVATFGAFALAVWRGVRGERAEGFDEACAVLLFYQVGEFFQGYATGKARRSVSSLMEIRPDFARVWRNGELTTLSPEEVSVGECITVLPGERVPLDGVVTRGASSLDCRALTGESLPQEVREGDALLSGCVNLSSQLEVRVQKAYHDSTVSRILELVENASDKKSRAEQFISRFASVYTPTVVALALLLAILPSLITGDWAVWVYRALSFLVVSCPCALVISVPLGFFGGLGTASRAGVLVKGGNYLEALAAVDAAAFDKTGTITAGKFVYSGDENAADAQRLHRAVAICEKYSTHPIAAAATEAFGALADGAVITEAAAIPGRGVRATVGDVVYLCGNAALMREEGIAFTEAEGLGTAVYAAENGQFLGSVIFADALKADSAAAIDAKLADLCISDEDKQIVRMRIVGRKKWAEIGAEVNCDRRTASRHFLSQVSIMTRSGARSRYIVSTLPALSIVSVTASITIRERSTR